MIKIIEEGQKKFVAVCRRCGCKYSYEVEDIIGDYVPCPDCGHIYAWKHMDYRETYPKTIIKNGEIGFWNRQPTTAGDLEHTLQKSIDNSSYGAHVKSNTEKNSFYIPVDETVTPMWKVLK